MINISLAGIGGQGSVLAAKILAEAARAKGWQVRSAETTGMAQRGGDVMSHVRIGDNGEEVFAPIPALASDDLIIAMEPGEGLRAMRYLHPEGTLVSATSGVAPTVGDFKAPTYNPHQMVEALQSRVKNLVVVNDELFCQQLETRKVLNIVMLAHALGAVNDPRYQNAIAGKITLDDMREAIPLCVHERFVQLNMKAIELVETHLRKA